MDKSWSTLLFAVVLESGPDDGTFVVDDDNTLDVFVGLHSVESLFDFGHGWVEVLKIDLIIQIYQSIFHEYLFEFFMKCISQMNNF